MLNNKWLPNLKDPKNEIIVVGNWLIAFLSVLVPLVTDADFTTWGGIVAFVTAASALLMRRGVWSNSSVAEVSAEPVGEVGVG